ncbi:MAG: protein translocase subunit SecD [Actinobacteria bacterium]|nr:protein translocase subunit SecD [Actinomycetota bacterium]
MRGRTWAVVGAIALLLAFASYVVAPNSPGIPLTLGERDLRDLRFRQGLDLQGGLHVRLEADAPPGRELQAGDLEAARRIIENRINALGVAEPVIQVEGDRRLIVELPGIDDPDEAIRLFRETGNLSIVDTGAEFFEENARLDLPERYPVVLTGRDLVAADVGYDQLGRPLVTFQLTEEAGARFETFTGANLGSVLTITIDAVVVNSARINGVIRDRGEITGRFQPDEAKRIAIQLRYGALPVPLKVVQTLSVRPTLGQESLAASVRAGLVGAILVALFMVLYYRVPGVVACLALPVYVVVVFACIKLVPITLTLAGVAGFILSVGVAVDANILIFERTREEVRSGRTIRTAIETGFNRAWPSIRDSNFTALIICVVLFGFGSGGIRGFAVTLALGIVMSMFSAITVSRTLLRVAVTIPGVRRPGLFGGEFRLREGEA